MSNAPIENRPYFFNSKAKLMTCMQLCRPNVVVQVNIVIARSVTAQIGYNTIRSWIPKFHTPLLGSLPENRVIKASCYAYRFIKTESGSSVSIL